MAKQLRMPALSQTMYQGRIVAWLKREGDSVNKGEPLVTVESDKASTDLDSPQTGVLRKILAEEGAEVDVEAPIAVIADADEDLFDLGRPQAGTGGVSPASAAATVGAPSAAPAGGRRPASPAARRLARELGIDIAQVTGTGEDGLITDKDVRAFASVQQGSPVAAPDDAEVIPLTGVRGRIAERLSLSRQTAADVTTVAEVDMTEVAALRKGQGLSYTAYVVWAAARALREFAILNAWLVDDRILVKKDVHVGVAVAIDNALVVPVLRHADRKSVAEIDEEINRLAERARAGQATPDDLKGSTFTVSNSGTFGSLMFTPIINLPEVAVLGVGKVADTPVVRDGEIVARKLMYLCLSYDHRAVDGAPAVKFLQAVKRYLERPIEQ